MKTILTIVLAVMLAGCVWAGDNAEPEDLAEGLAQLDSNVEQSKGQIDAGLFRAFFTKYRTPPADPKLRASWYAHTTRYQNGTYPMLFNRREQGEKGSYQIQERTIGIGKLGLPFETVVTIQGVREERGKVGTRTLAVTKVNGEPLEELIRIWIDNIQRPGLPAGKPCVLKGYETGTWIGGDPNQQASWQFYHKFFVTEVVSPEEVKLVIESQQGPERDK